MPAEFVGGDNGDGGIHVGRGDGERHADGRWKCDGHGECRGDQLHEYCRRNADGNLQRRLYAGSGSHFDRDAGCGGDLLRLDGCIMHKSDSDDVQLSGDKYDADRCGGYVYGWWWRSDTFLSDGASYGNSGDSV